MFRSTFSVLSPQIDAFWVGFFGGVFFIILFSFFLLHTSNVEGDKAWLFGERVV